MVIEKVSAKEFEFIDEKLVSYNAKCCNLSSSQVFDGIYKCAKVDGEIIGGIAGFVELECALHITVLYVDDIQRGQNIGNELLSQLENDARKMGAEFAYLETFDFQAKGFYEKNGYTVFSKLDYKTGNTIYFMKKEF